MLSMSWEQYELYFINWTEVNQRTYIGIWSLGKLLKNVSVNSLKVTKLYHTWEYLKTSFMLPPIAPVGVHFILQDELSFEFSLNVHLLYIDLLFCT